MSWPKKRDASTELLQRLHGYMREHNVDFIGGDFNMSAFSTVVKCFRTRSLQNTAIRFCGDLARWRSRIVSALSFSSCQSVHTSDVWIHMATTSLTMLRLAWDLEIKLLTFLFSSISVPPICLDPAASCVVNKRNKGGLSADTINTNVCGDDVHDRDPVHQGHVSVSYFTPFAVARESFASQLCLPAALTHGRVASSLCLCLCLCQLGLAGQGRVREGTLKPCA